MPESLVNAGATIVLDGRELILRYRALAFIRYAEETESDLLADIRDISALGEALKAGGKGGGKLFRMVSDILWAGLLHEQPDMTRDETARLFGLDDLPALMPAITQALRGTLPAAVEGEERPMKAPKSIRRAGHTNAGSSSGPSSATDQESAPANSVV